MKYKSKDIENAVVTYVATILSVPRTTNAHTKLTKKLLSDCLWTDTEKSGKYVGCPYWSEKAIESHKEHGRVVTSRRDHPEDALVHEHLVPRNETITMLLNLDTPTQNQIKEILSLNIGVVVTAGEDSTLPKKGTINDPWQRYRDADIKWVEMK